MSTPTNTQSKSNPPPQRKRLIVLCDGTEQSAALGEDALPTNVKRFGDCLDSTYAPDTNSPNLRAPQIVFYQSGVGTSGTWLGKKIAQAGGDGVDENILDAYIFLCNNHNDGDEISIFGFSRGAFTARVLANLVVRVGLFRKSVSWMTRIAWNRYRKKDKGASFDFFVDQLNQMRDDSAMSNGGVQGGLSKNKKNNRNSGFAKQVNVKVLGVWDTVGAIGIPDYGVVDLVGASDRHMFYDTRLHYGIENVFHALALDEYRLPFNPTLFYIPLDEPPKSEDGKQRKVPVLKQCWFAGAHTDIGGGYASEHQGNITLAWMIDQCRSRGFLEFFTGESPVQTVQTPARTLTEEELDNLRLSLPKYLRIIRDHHYPSTFQDDLHQPKPKILEMNYWWPDEAKASEKENPGWGCGYIRDSFKDMTTAVTWQARAPGNYDIRGSHPGKAGMKFLPDISGITEGAVSLMSYIPGVNRLRSKELPPDEPTGECSHPAARWDKKGGTNETIHASVWARWEAKQNPSSLPAEVQRKLQNWKPEALVMFQDDKGQIKRERVGSDAPKGYNFVWKGKCIRTKREFEMYEEPNNVFPPDGSRGIGMTELLMDKDRFMDVLARRYPFLTKQQLELKVRKPAVQTFWLRSDFDLDKWRKDNPDKYEEYRSRTDRGNGMEKDAGQ